MEPCRKTSYRGFLSDPSAKDNRLPKFRVVRRWIFQQGEHPPHEVSERNITIALRVKTNTELKRTHGIVEVKKTVESYSTWIEDPEVLFKVPPTGVPFFAKIKYDDRIGIGKYVCTVLHHSLSRHPRRAKSYRRRLS